MLPLRPLVLLGGIRPIFFITALAAPAAGVCLGAPEGKKQQPLSPFITFAPDEQTVTVRYDKGEWIFARPVVSPWKVTAAGKTRWVAVTGDDANAGSADKPLKTIGKAIALAEPGDVLYARAGTYVEHLTFTKSGREGKPIILSCAPGDLGRVKVTPPKEYVARNPGGAVIYLENIAHVWINGLVIAGPRGRPEAPRQETFGANGITWRGRGQVGLRATNNVIYGNVHCGLKEMDSPGVKVFLEGNVIFENGTEGRDHGIYCPANDAVINGNIIFNNAGYGIHSYEHPRGQVITRNICIGNQVAGIILAGSRNKVYHNVCTGNAIGLFYFRRGCTENDVRNNIFAFNRVDCGWDNGGGKLGDPARNRDDYNCYFPGKPNKRIGPGAHEVLADPRFVDARKGDYRLRKDSPGRGKGVDVGLPCKGKAPDLGAFSK